MECTETWTVTVFSLYHSNGSVQHWCSGIYILQPIFFSLWNASLHFIHKCVCCLYYGLPWASSCFYLGVSDLPSWASWACWIFLPRTDHFVCGFLIQMGNAFMQVYVLYTRTWILNSCIVWFFPLTCFHCSIIQYCVGKCVWWARQRVIRWFSCGQLQRRLEWLVFSGFSPRKFLITTVFVF